MEILRSREKIRIVSYLVGALGARQAVGAFGAGLRTRKHDRVMGQKALDTAIAIISLISDIYHIRHIGDGGVEVAKIDAEEARNILASEQRSEEQYLIFMTDGGISIFARPHSNDAATDIFWPVQELSGDL